MSGSATVACLAVASLRSPFQLHRVVFSFPQPLLLVVSAAPSPLLVPPLLLCPPPHHHKHIHTCSTTVFNAIAPNVGTGGRFALVGLGFQAFLGKAEGGGC